MSPAIRGTRRYTPIGELRHHTVDGVTTVVEPSTRNPETWIIIDAQEVWDLEDMA